MRRREFITLLGATVIGSRAVSAQTSPKDFHLGTVTPGMPLDENSPGGQILIRVLGERGYKLGQNLKFSSRGAMRKISSLPDILHEMKANRVDALVILGHPTAVAAKSTGIATVIAYGAGDPVAKCVRKLPVPGHLRWKLSARPWASFAMNSSTKFPRCIARRSPKLRHP